jgi:A/G-specific adenine glycosylase
VPSILSNSVLKWYKKYGRNNLPWKVKDPYKIWISEIMLQQTQVSTVIPYYLKFTKKYPDLKSLASADLDDLMLIWSGLGYYRRIKNIHLSSQIIARKHNYNFPSEYDDILSLPGIGRTTASAISTFSGFSNKAILDGNVKRILTRFYEIEEENKTVLEKKLWDKSVSITPLVKTSDFIQGMMDIGSIICKRTNPECCKCPLKSMGCSYNPSRKKKRKIKQKIKDINMNLIVLINQSNQIYLEKIKAGMLWQGLYSVPIFTSNSLTNKWMLRNNLSVLKPTYRSKIFHRVTDKKIMFNALFYFLKNDKKVSLSSKNWYNLANINVGVPRYLDKALDIYRSEYEKNNV